MSTNSPENTSITHDSSYYVTAGFFALLTTGLPAILGQPRFLPIVQTLALFTFVAIALRHHNVRGAIRILAMWLPIQFVIITLLTRYFPAQLEAAFTNGFEYRNAIALWFFADAPHPATITSAPGTNIVNLLVVTLGSLITAGLAGMWTLVRLLNQAAYGTGLLLALITNPTQVFLVIPYWTLLRAAAYVGWIVLCAMPLLTSNWSPDYYWRNHKQLITIATALLVTGIILELFLPSLVARPPVN